MSMFPPELSKQILDNRIKHKNLFYIPGKSDAIWSYLYYICYFKNKDSLIPIHKVSDIQEYRRKLWARAMMQRKILCQTQVDIIML